MIDDVHNNGSGSIDIDEYCHTMTAKIGERDSKQSSKQELRKAFQIIDHDKNENISVDDIQKIAMEFGERFTFREVQEMIADADSDDIIWDTSSINDKGRESTLCMWLIILMTLLLLNGVDQIRSSLACACGQHFVNSDIAIVQIR